MSTFSSDLRDWVISIGGKVQGPWASIKAPCHNDNSPSGRIKLEDGWFWCNACGEGCWSDQLADRYGMPKPPLKEREAKDEELRKVMIGEYIYTDAKGEPLYKAVKTIENGRKSFSQARWDGKQWDFSTGCMDNVQRVLFDLPAILKNLDSFVLLVEGEKDVRTAQRLGFVATTAPQGAQKADKVRDWSPLAGREVVIIEDNDEAGRKHTEQLLGLLDGIAAKVVVLRLDDLPEHGDLTDWVEMGGDAHKLEELVCDLLNKASADRRWIEYHYLVSAWNHQASAEILTSFDLSHWKDYDARKVVTAIKDIVAENKEVGHCEIAEKMRQHRTLTSYQAVEAFETEQKHRVKVGADGPREQFSKAIQRDVNNRLFSKMRQMLDGDPSKFIASLHEETGNILARTGNKKLRTLREICDEQLNKVIRGEPRAETVYIPIVSDALGEFGPGDVIAFGGPPGTGKSFMLGTIRRGLSKAGVPHITGQYELRDDQEGNREISHHTGSKDIDQVTAQRMLKNETFSYLDVSYFLNRADSIESCQKELWPILAANPKIKVWLLDYNERLYQYGQGRVDVNSMAARVAKFAKDTAKRFGIIVVVLLQPNDRYYAEGANGPRADHFDYGKQWNKDASALGFMHKPHRFNPEMPKDLIEFHWLKARDEETKIQKMRFEPQRSRFVYWDGNVPEVAVKSGYKGNQKANAATEKLRTNVNNNELYEDISDEDERILNEFNFI